jgi:hypothetical protein
MTLTVSDRAFRAWISIWHKPTVKSIRHPLVALPASSKLLHHRTALQPPPLALSRGTSLGISTSSALGSSGRPYTPKGNHTLWHRPSLRFDYPFDGLLRPKPCRLYFTPAALMRFLPKPMCSEGSFDPQKGTPIPASSSRPSPPPR